MTDPRQHAMDDLEVRVGRFVAEQQSYEVSVRFADGSDADGWLNLQNLEPPPEGNTDDLVAYGLDLFSRLFHEDLADAFDRAFGAARARQRGLRLRLWIDNPDPRLHTVPWELIHYDDSGGLAPPLPLATSDQIAFSRYLASSEPQGSPIQRRPLRMLVVISAPTDLGTDWPDLAPIDKTAEKRDLRSVFNAMQNAGQLDVSFLEQATPENLHAELERGYDVLLYDGHGIHSPTRGTRLVLEDSTGKALLYNGDELVKRLKDSTSLRPSLLVLVACNTAATRTDTLGSLAAQLVQQAGVPAVLAMQNLIKVTLARSFTHHLSEYLLQHGIVDRAVNDVRRRIVAADERGWSTPLLYMRYPDGRLFAPNAALEYAQALLEDPQFVRWQQAEFIEVEAITVPQGHDWGLLKTRPEDAPPGTDALKTLLGALQLEQKRATPNLIVLLGPPQSGQTTTLRRLAADLAVMTRNPDQQCRIAGVYVPLPNYGERRGSGQYLEQLIIETASERTPFLATELQRVFDHIRVDLGSQYEVPRFVFILDGLDMIPEQQRRGVSAAIVDLARDLPEQRFVVSCTNYLFPAHIFEPAALLLLQPLNERQVLRYLRQRNPQRSAEIFRRIAENRLLDLVTDPAILARIYEQLTEEPSATFTRNQLMRSLLDQALSTIGIQYMNGDAARETLIALAWEMRWQHRETLSLHEVFASMARVRGERDYDLEMLYGKLREAGLLVDVGQQMVRFAYTTLQSYCTALALNRRTDFQQRLDDIIAMCGVSERLAWWEDVLYALAGMLTTVTPLLSLKNAAFRDNCSAHTLLVARCLEALSSDIERNLASRDRQELIDACAIRLRPEREPSAERRAQIATALGRLPYPQTIRELCRLLSERVRPAPGGARYDYTNVRIAAARALRTLVARLAETTQPATVEEGTVYPSLPSLCVLQHTQIELLKQELHDRDAYLFTLLQAWVNGADGREEVRQTGLSTLRETLVDTTCSVLARTIAAFALGDLAYEISDAELLLNIVVYQPMNPSPEAEDIPWSAADALTFFPAEEVTRLLVEQFRKGEPPAISIPQMTYIAGRVRAQDEAILEWLINLVLEHPDHFVKARALRSLAWFGKSLQASQRLHAVVRTMFDLDPEVQFDQIIRQVVTDIAVWNLPALERLGSFDTQNPDDPAAIYLRQEAIKALAWIGDQATLNTIYEQVTKWMLELREAWYITAAAIQRRMTTKRDLR